MKKINHDMYNSTRACGILMPLFSLPSKYGIGCLSQEAKTFIDLLSESGHTYWQMLPLGPAGSCNSPYQPRSCFAGDPVFIDPQTLIRKGLLTSDDIACVKSGLPVASDDSRIDYDTVITSRNNLLRAAYERFTDTAGVQMRNLERFCHNNEFWLDDHAMFEAISCETGTSLWSEWDRDIRNRNPHTLSVLKDKLRNELDYRKWLQYEFFCEFTDIKKYADIRGIRLIGDVLIYASYESSDCWAHSELFQLESDKLPARLSGSPPDDFNPKGQVWGHPLYDWDVMKQNGYDWWIRRITHDLAMYDLLRLDHVRGFESYFSIPAGTDDAADGRWEPGPGMDFFNTVYRALGKHPFIAEDLGYITPAVRQMVADAELPEMKVLQFAFDSDPDNPYLPENYRRPCVAYTGTHDNDTTCGWYSSLPVEEKTRITAYLRTCRGIHPAKETPFFGTASANELLIETAMFSPADTCIIPMQDYLGLGSDARTNTPGTISGNWEWRMKCGAFSHELTNKLADLAARCGRLKITASV